MSSLHSPVMTKEWRWCVLRLESLYRCSKRGINREQECQNEIYNVLMHSTGNIVVLETQSLSMTTMSGHRKIFKIEIRKNIESLIQKRNDGLPL